MLRQSRNPSQRNRRFTRRPYGSLDTNFKDVPTYCVLDIQSDSLQICNSVDHARAVAFGTNKRLREQRYLACYRSPNGFYCM